MKFGYFKYVLVLLSVCAVSCNLSDSYSDCPPPEIEDDIRQLLYLRISDVLTEEDVTSIQELDDITVFLFDQDRKLVESVPYTTAMIREAVPLDLTDRNLEGGYVSVWANLGEKVSFANPEIGDRIDDLSINMLPNASHSGYFSQPGDIFFGFEQIDFHSVDQTTEADTVFLKRKNGRLSITVRGLTETRSDDAYYFRIGLLCSGYNYSGLPAEIVRNMWETGAFQGDDYVTVAPYWMFHHPSGLVYSDDHTVCIDVYRSSPARADTLLGSATKDMNGEYISLTSGLTTNVLLDIDPKTGELSVRIALTPWDEIHQWANW